MNTKLFLAEQKKTFGRSVVWITIAAIAIFVAAMVALAHLSGLRAAAQGIDTEGIPVTTWPYGLATTLAQFLNPGYGGGIAIVVLTSALWADEFRWRTVQFWLSRGITRRTLVTTKLATIVLPIVALILIGTLAGGVSSYLITLSSNQMVDWQMINAGQLVLSIVRASAALMPFAAMAILAGVLTHSTAGTLGASLGYLVLGEKIIAAVLNLVGLEGVAQDLPVAMATTLSLWNGLVVAGTSQADLALAQPESSALIGTLAWTVILTAAAVRILQQQDLTD